MTQYTTPHSLPLTDTTDLIAGLENLRTRLNAISQAANAAITLEGARAESASMTSAVADAKTYADSQVSKNLAAAVSYADAGDAATRNYVSTSHIAIDTDGTPFVRLGSMTARVLQDTDGTPYYEAA